MKKIFNLALGIFVTILIFSGCQDRTNLTAPTVSPQSGSADLTRYVSIGNSLTAGYQSGALYQSAQVYAYDNLISKQAGTTFAMPLISDPGIGGRIKIQSLDIAKGEIVLAYDGSTGTPENLTYPAPYNNLGIPGALVYDVLNATSSTTCASYVFGNPATRTPNPFFDIILRGSGSQFAQAKLLHPTFLSLWIGNNDVLGFATSGGFSPSAPTPTAQFQYLFSQLGDSIASLGAKVAVANIPDVTSIPFFNTVGPLMAMEIPWGVIRLLGAPGLVYQKHGETIATGVADSLSLLTGGVLITLTASNYATLVGKPGGQFYRDNHYPALPPGIDTTKPFGLHPQNPWPDALILDASEINTAKTSTAAFNAAIAAVVAKYPNQFALVDINSIFNNIRAHDFSGGTVYNGVRFFTSYITGGLFSLDGVHPTDQGQAIIADEFIKIINSKFGANYPLVDVASIPGSLILAKRGLFTGTKLPYFEPGAFDHLLY
ncbi:MAG: SGNH/GDSL hydrolase family protein [Bacteroidetes bacterium]|nr:SGNH/GDSL hydrolase family protein [Bacteroidota bacterium]